MARVAVTELQRRGAINNGWGLYNLKAGWSGSVRYGLPAVKAGLPYYAPDWNPPHTPKGDVFHGRGMTGPRWGLGASCVEGSHLVNGECVCYEGRVWMPDRSKCVSPQSPAYIQAVGGGAPPDVSQMSPTEYGQQELSAYARNYLQSQGYTINCKIDYSNWAAGPQGGAPANMCSINGGPYEHAAYIINQNPYNVIPTVARETAVNLVSRATGIAPGALYTTPETIAAVDQAMATGQVGSAAGAAAPSLQAKQELSASLVPGVDYDINSGAPLSWKAEVAGSNRVTADLVQEALALPPGATLQDPSGRTNQAAANYTHDYTGAQIAPYQGGGGGGGSTVGGSGGGSGGGGTGGAAADGGIPWWVWAGAAGAAYFVMKGK